MCARGPVRVTGSKRSLEGPISKLSADFATYPARVSPARKRQPERLAFTALSALVGATRPRATFRPAPISLKKAASGNWHEGAALIHSGR